MTNSGMDPDPNGDVILVVSPPKQLRAYAPSRVYADGEAGVVRYRASSKHLTLASPYFEKRLKKEWGEGKQLQKNGCVEMHVPDTDPEAFSILLNLIHCRTQEVPTSVTFDVLVELAVQVDYFKCHGVLGLYLERWIQPLKAKRPTTYCDEVVKWIFVSGVFNDGNIYTSATNFAARQTKDLINTLGLPIPLSVTAIDGQRKDLLRLLFKAVEARRQKLETGEITCTFECDSLTLGTLMKRMKARGLSWSQENRDYKGLAPDELAKELLEFEHPSCKIPCKGRCRGLDGPGGSEEYRRKLTFGLRLAPEKWR